MPCEHFVEDSTKRENIGARIGRPALGLLRRHVCRRAHDGAGLGDADRSGLHAVRARAKTKPARSRKRKLAALGKVPQNYDPLRAAFYVSDDYTSLASLELHYTDLDLLIPEALHAVSPDGRLDIEQDPKLVAWMQTSQVELPIMAMVNNYDGKDWLIKEMAVMLANPVARQKLSKSLTDFATAQHDPGIVVDFEQVPDSSQQDFTRFIGDLGNYLRVVDRAQLTCVGAGQSAPGTCRRLRSGRHMGMSRASAPRPPSQFATTATQPVRPPSKAARA